MNNRGVICLQVIVLKNIIFKEKPMVEKSTLCGSTWFNILYFPLTPAKTLGMPPSRIFCGGPGATCRGTKDPYGDRIRSGHHIPTKHHHNTSKQKQHLHRKNGEQEIPIKRWEMGCYVSLCIFYCSMFWYRLVWPKSKENRLKKHKWWKETKIGWETNMI